MRGDGQVDAYLVHRTAGLDEKAVEDLSGDIATIPEDRLGSVINYVENKVEEIIEAFRLVTTDGVSP